MDSADFIKGLLATLSLSMISFIFDNIFRNLTVQVVSNIIFLLSFPFLVPEKDKNIDLYPRIIFLLVLLWPRSSSKNTTSRVKNPPHNIKMAEVNESDRI